MARYVCWPWLSQALRAAWKHAIKVCSDKLENDEWKREVEKLRCMAEYYLKWYTREIESEAENQRVSDEEVLGSLEKTLEEYKKRFLEKRVE